MKFQVLLSLISTSQSWRSNGNFATFASHLQLFSSNMCLQTYQQLELPVIWSIASQIVRSGQRKKWQCAISPSLAHPSLDLPPVDCVASPLFPRWAVDVLFVSPSSSLPFNALMAVNCLSANFDGRKRRERDLHWGANFHIATREVYGKEEQRHIGNWKKTKSKINLQAARVLSQT